MNLRLGITGKLLVWFLFILGIFVGTILILYININEVVRLSESIVGKNYAISSRTKKMVESLLGMEENKQKFLLLGKSDYLAFYNKAQREYEENLSQLTRLVNAGHEISSLWTDLIHAYEIHPSADEVANLIARRQNAPETISSFFIPESTINEWIKKISGERLKNEQEIERTIREVNRKGRLSARLGLIGLGISGIVGLIGVFYLTYSMLTPLRELMESIHKISSDRQMTPIKIRSRDELGELAHAFNEMSERLRKEERMRSDFISMLSHEIRTPLTSIRESVNMIREEVMGPINERQERFLTIAGSEITRISDLLSHLMQASRLEPGLLNMQLESIDPYMLVCDCTDSIKLSAEAKNIEMKVDIPTSIPHFMGDRRKLQQAMMNYLSNAIKFSESETRITTGVRLEESGEHISFYVKDNGPGILEEDQAFLFNKYYRGQRERERLEGVGLGLSIVKNIIESHHGKVWVESRVGKGCIFGFTLPCSLEL